LNATMLAARTFAISGVSTVNRAGVAGKLPSVSQNQATTNLPSIPKPTLVEPFHTNRVYSADLYALMASAGVAGVPLAKSYSLYPANHQSVASLLLANALILEGIVYSKTFSPQFDGLEVIAVFPSPWLEEAISAL